MPAIPPNPTRLASPAIAGDEEPLIKLSGAFDQFNTALSHVHASLEGILPSMKGLRAGFLEFPGALSGVGDRTKTAFATLTGTLIGSTTKFLSELGANFMDSLRKAFPKTLSPPYETNLASNPKPLVQPVQAPSLTFGPDTKTFGSLTKHASPGAPANPMSLP